MSSRPRSATATFVNAEMIFLKIVGAMFLAIAGRKILTPGV